MSVGLVLMFGRLTSDVGGLTSDVGGLLLMSAGLLLMSVSLLLMSVGLSSDVGPGLLMMSVALLSDVGGDLLLRAALHSWCRPKLLPDVGEATSGRPVSGPDGFHLVLAALNGVGRGWHPAFRAKKQRLS